MQCYCAERDPGEDRSGLTERLAVDPVDAAENMRAIDHTRKQGIHVVLFDSPSPDPTITSIGNDFSQQGIIAAERLADLIGYAGEAAVMQGYPHGSKPQRAV